MTKIFMYELRRLLLNKFFITLAFINGFYAWFVLSTQTIMGTAFTAPFSQWSFGGYLAAVMPMIMLTTLFLLSFYYSRNEKQVAVLTSATPMDRRKYMLVRNAVVALGFLFLCLVAVILAIFFYASIFRFTSFGGFALPGVIIILPGFVLFMGLGHFVGKIHVGFLYALIPLLFLMGFLPLILDIFGGGFFNNFPLTLPVAADGEPAFVLSAGFIITRIMYMIVGIGLWMVRIKKGAVA